MSLSAALPHTAPSATSAARSTMRSRRVASTIGGRGASGEAAAADGLHVGPHLAQRLREVQALGLHHRVVADTQPEAEAPRGQLVDVRGHGRGVGRVAHVDGLHPGPEGDLVGHVRQRDAQAQRVGPQAGAPDAVEPEPLDLDRRVQQGLTAAGSRGEGDRRQGAHGPSFRSSPRAGLVLLGDAEALEAEALDGVAAHELVDLVVVEAGVHADLGGDLLGVREGRVGVGVVAPRR